jgi:hypothetical protein
MASVPLVRKKKGGRRRAGAQRWLLAQALGRRTTFSGSRGSTISPWALQIARHSRNETTRSDTARKKKGGGRGREREEGDEGVSNVWCGPLSGKGRPGYVHCHCRSRPCCHGRCCGKCNTPARATLKMKCKLGWERHWWSDEHTL